MNKFTTALVHLVGFALVVALGAYWAVRILTPQPTAAPPPLAAPPPREPDPVATARMFGLVQMAAAVVTNIQVSGVFAAGRDSSAVLVVDGKPPRAFVIGQEVAPGTTLLQVTPDTVTLDTGTGRQELRAPARAAPVSLATTQPVVADPGFVRQGNTLSAPGSAAPSFAAPTSTPAPQFVPPPQQFPQPAMPQQPMPMPPKTENTEPQPAPGTSPPVAQ